MVTAGRLECFLLNQSHLIQLLLKHAIYISLGSLPFQFPARLLFFWFFLFQNCPADHCDSGSCAAPCAQTQLTKSKTRVQLNFQNAFLTEQMNFTWLNARVQRMFRYSLPLPNQANNHKNRRDECVIRKMFWLSQSYLCWRGRLRHAVHVFDNP